MKKATLIAKASVLLVFFLLMAGQTTVVLWAQSQDVTFRYIPGPSDNTVRVFVPGTFNNWGSNNAGAITIGNESQMEFVDSLKQWIKTLPLQIGQTYQYKVHFHFNESGSDWDWITDPINPRSNPADNNNSVVTITDPMAFQAAYELTEDGLIGGVSAGLFSTASVSDVSFWINGIEQDGLDFYNPENGIFRYTLDRPIKAGSQFKIRFVDEMGRSDSLEIGSILLPVSWVNAGFSTVKEEAELLASVTRQDGTIDSTLTSAMLYAGEGMPREVSVTNGTYRENVALDLGENLFRLEAIVDGNLFVSDSLVIVRKRHPLASFLVEPSATGSGNAFTVTVTPTDAAPADLSVIWSFDEISSTTGIDGLVLSELDATGTATGPGELYFDVTATGDGLEDVLRIAVIIEPSGDARLMAYEETPAWVNQSVVYEIFPLTFGPEADGSEANPGRRFQEITEELDYIAEMGFNVIWFMPVMKNQFMDPISGGYNIVDFYNVDPKLGTNDDFKNLVARAHELGIKIIMDITPNHASPVHPWVEALRTGGHAVPPGSFIQTSPSPHNQGLDGRGPNLSEVWQVSDGGNLYRKYDGFGDLANLDWDNDDLQAEFLDILAHWIKEFDIDGWRFDVYWGPWRRYGPDRFGRPIRQLMKRIKPDSWLLGEIAGTGFSTEVYYADDDFGTSVVGGIDAGYDWTFFFEGIGGTYGNITNYDSKARNGNFWPGPHARYFRFLENHDEERIAKRLRATPDRILPLTGLILTTTGVPMIYQGQEVNYGDVSGDERRTPVSWQTERNAVFARYHQQLAHVRAQFEAFGSQQIETLNTSNSVYAFVRPYLDENAVVLINFSSENRDLKVNPTSVVDLTTDGPITYTHLFADTSFVDNELDGFDVTLAPYETLIFIANGGEPVTFDLPELPSLPYQAIYTGNEANPPETMASFSLAQNYPNPLSDLTTVQFSIPDSGPVRLSIYDILGRQRLVLVNEVMQAGRHEVTINSTSLPAGTYYYRLQAAGQIATKSMSVVK